MHRHALGDRYAPNLLYDARHHMRTDLPQRCCSPSYECHFSRVASQRGNATSTPMIQNVPTVMTTARIVATTAWATVCAPTRQRAQPTSATSGVSRSRVGPKSSTKTVTLPAMLPPDTPTVMPPNAVPLGCVLVCMSMRVERAPDAVVVRTCALPQIAMASECFFAIRSVTYMIERTWDAFTRVKRKQQRHE